MACRVFLCVFAILLTTTARSLGQAPEPMGTLSLEQAAALALEHNPSLQVYPWDVRVAEAHALQASLFPNPELSLEVEELRLSGGPEERRREVSLDSSGPSFLRERTGGGPSGFEEAEFTLRVSQLFLLGGKRKKAVEVAHRERAAAEWDYEIARINVLRDVARAYLMVLAAQDRVSERRQIMALAENVEETIGARADAGKVSPIERKRASVSTMSAAIELERALRHLKQARVGLAATWGSAQPAFESVSGTLHSATALPDAELLLERSTTNPDLQRWQYEIARRESVLRLARAERIPDLTASLGLVTQGLDGRGSRSVGLAPDGPFFTRSSSGFDDSRDNRIELQISIPLPIFDRNQGNIREAEYLLSKVDDERFVTLAAIRTAIMDGYQAAMAAYDETVTLEERALPVAEDAFNSVQLGYDEGKFGYLEVLDAQRTLFELRIQLLEAFLDYHLSVVELERLLGEALWSTAEVFGSSIEETNHE